MLVVAPRKVVKTATMLALLVSPTGCTSLTNNGLDPTVSVADPKHSKAPATPKEAPEVPQLAPGEGEVLRGKVSSKDELTGSTLMMEKAETSILWACVGTGAFAYSFGGVSSNSGECGKTEPVKIRQNRFPVTESQELSLQVKAQAGQEWDLIVIQKTDQ